MSAKLGCHALTQWAPLVEMTLFSDYILVIWLDSGQQPKSRFWLYFGHQTDIYWLDFGCIFVIKLSFIG